MRRVALTMACLLGLSTPSLADPAVGLGFSYAFGGGESQAGIGLRVFSDDEYDSYVASAGVDYMFGSQNMRGTVGAAYLGDDLYLGLDLGLNFSGGGMTFGPSFGGVNTKKPAAAAPPPEEGGGGELLASPQKVGGPGFPRPVRLQCKG